MVLEAIRGVVHRIGLETTMAPKPYLDGAGNGHHLHLSLYEGRRPGALRRLGRLSKAGSGFVGGVLEHLPAVMAFTAASPNSYQRLAPGMWSSAYACYGPDNREAAVRLASPVAGVESATANVEIKPVDVTANPYLALAAVLAAGMDGMERSSTRASRPRSTRPRSARRSAPSGTSAPSDLARPGLERAGERRGPYRGARRTARAHPPRRGRAQAEIARELSPEEVAAAAAVIY